ncbi:MAG: major facilitator superfamily transporter [Bacteroidetes bacterium]|nr:major facilitator superfamily transporter [Bacteroidota bacterium]
MRRRPPPAPRPPIHRLRWWIGAALFASTVINYIDRQTLSVLVPFLKREYQWTNEDYAMIVVSFRVAYAIGQTALGRLMDRLGTRLGLTVTVAFYSLVAMLSSFAGGLRSFAFFRFFLGLGESANWPAATKAVAEWFPRKERGWAVALFDSGSSIGAAIAPALVIGLYSTFGDWRPAFILTGSLGFLWIILWRSLYHPPEVHPRISPEEREMILADREESASEPDAGEERPGIWKLLGMRQTWGVIIARAFTDPVWFFIADWFMIYLVSKGFNPEATLIAFWIPFVAADLGNFAGGGFSSWLIRKGWGVGRARKAVVLFGAIGMTTLIPTIYLTGLFAIAGLFAVSTFAYAAYSTIALVLPSDMYRSSSVATVSGLSGTAAGILTIISTFLIGWISDRYSFEPILIAASIIPAAGAVLTFLLVRNTRESGAGVLRKI